MQYLQGVVARFSDSYRPRGQSEHSALPTFAAYLPGSQSRQNGWPLSIECKPAAHERQTLLGSVFPRYFPGMQSWHPAPAFPPGQSWHDAEPDTPFVYFPAMHLEQDVELVSNAYSSTLHGTQDTDSDSEVERPGIHIKQDDDLREGW